MRFPLLAIFAFLSVAWSQNPTSQLNGVVTDPQGAAVAGATVKVVNSETNTPFSTVTNDHGEWVVPSLPTAIYRISVSVQGFKTANVQNVKLNAGVPATVNIVLEVGAVNDTVEVTTGAEILQTTSSSVSSTLVGRQINQLPMSTRNALELLVTQPGTQTPGTARTSSINGLPKGSLNLTLDGINIQDNLLKSSDGFFTEVQPKPDAIEEVTLTTAGGGADVLGEGAAQVRFVTKSGTNEFHGGVFWQHRNTFFNANYYFNNQQGLGRDRIILNQFGGHVGGPIKKNKAFFFVNDEFFRLPQTYNSSTLRVPTASAVNGIYTYSAAGKLQTVNLYDLARTASVPAGTRAFASTPDPLILATLQQMVSLASPSAGSLISRIASSGDYNRNDYKFQTPGNNKRSFPTAKVDYNLTSKHHVDLVVNYQKYLANPDGVNGILPILPGTGTVLGSDPIGGTRRISFSGTTSVRSAWTSRLTSEIRFGLLGGNSLFREEITPNLFDRWKGYATVFNSTTAANQYVSSPYLASSQSRRNSPVKQGGANFTWAKSNHTINFGGSFTQVNLYQLSTGSQVFPSVTFNVATGDPVNSGATSLFTATNFPGSTAAQRTEAAQLYAILTGRVSTITRSLALDEKTGKYANIGSVDRDRQREFAFFAQDSWRVTRGLTVNYGLRWDIQLPFENLSGIYTTTGIEGAWGISGVGNLFRPGTLTGVANPAYRPVDSGDFAYKTNYRGLSPSIGFAWKVPEGPSILRFLTGKEGQSVLRAGYAISTIREGTGTYVNILGSNQGRTLSTTIDPGNFPAEFGAPGSALFRDPTLPARSVSLTPTYPLAVAPSNSINEFDPKIRQAYVQSWTLSFQREVAKDTVVDVRYVGNHGTKLWQQVNINEVNIFENGFLNEFKVAQNNLAIAQRQNPASVNFGNQGLPGQGNVPILQTALGFVSDTATATTLQQGQAGSLANSIAFNTTRMANLTKAGYPVNMFVANPSTTAGSFLMTNGGHSTYNALQVEVRRRFSGGLLAQGSYVWSKSLTNMFASSSAVFSQPTTFRNTGLDKAPSPWDIRHGFKVNWIYELPFGPGRRFLGGYNNVVARKVLEGWEIAGSPRIQSGSPAFLRSGRQTFNSASGQSSSADAGVVLHGLDRNQLQSMMQIRKTDGGLVYYLPQSLVDNSLAAFEVGGKTLADLDPSKPYIGPPTEAGRLGERIMLYSPWQARWDLSILKRTKLGERKNFEIRAQFLNAFNQQNFLFGAAGNDVNTILLTSATMPFGQTTSAYRDITVSGANDPGARLVEFQLRFNF